MAELTAKDPAARPASAASVAARAGQLRAAITGTATITTDRPAAGLPGPLPPTLAGVTVHHTPRLGRLRLGRLRPRRLVALAVAMLLAAWLTAEMSGAASRTQPASPAPAASGVPAARMVIVDDAALAGQPAGPVLRQLRRAGLRPGVVRVPDGHLAAGTVISVRPAGQVLVGGTVTVTTAIAPPGHRRGRGNGEGDGNDG